MKALEILKVCRERGQKRAGGISLDEAIEELEALQQPKSCEGCRSKSCSIKRILLELEEMNSSYFYCNDFEP